MKRTLSGLLYWTVKIGLMILLFGIINERVFGLFDDAGFWEIMSILWTVVGMNAGVTVGLALMSKLRMPGWLMGILTLALTLLGSYYVEMLMIWVYQLIFAACAKIVAMVICILMILGMTGILGYVLFVIGLWSFVGVVKRNS